jgi:hypothetical protein
MHPSAPCGPARGSSRRRFASPAGAGAFVATRPLSSYRLVFFVAIFYFSLDHPPAITSAVQDDGGVLVIAALYRVQLDRHVASAADGDHVAHAIHAVAAAGVLTGGGVYSTFTSFGQTSFRSGSAMRDSESSMSCAYRSGTDRTPPPQTNARDRRCSLPVGNVQGFRQIETPCSKHRDQPADAIMLRCLTGDLCDVKR